METEDTRRKVQKLLEAYGQEHLLRFYGELSDNSRRKLLDQVQRLDLEKLATIWNKAAAASDETRTGDDIAPIQAYDSGEFTAEERRRYEDAGWAMLRQGQVGAIVVAGGQGSRLGYDGPKGTFDIGLPSGKSLFQLQAERLLNLGAKAGRAIPWYVMTSPDNHDDTVRFFERSDYFGMRSDDVFFFTQGVMPAMDADGRILLADKDAISLAPSGNGDCFAALQRSGALADMKRRGLVWLFYYNVDNALVKVADPLFVGVAAFQPYPVAAKAVDKSGPEERVGILYRKAGRPAVVEYTVIPDRLKYAEDAQGKLLYGLGNISMQLFRLDFIERYAGAELPYEMAHKKISCIGPSGEAIEPDKPNAYKFERFIFDYFPLADDITVLKVKRDEEFAPVKNKDGEDSPATARKLVYALYRKWLLEAGVSPDRLGDRDVEISPLLSYAGEGLAEERILSVLKL